MNIKDIEARAEAATPLTVEKLTGWHSLCGKTNCTVCFLLAQLKAKEETLESMREYGQLLAGGHASGTWQGLVKAELDRILEGGE